jgi:hypothetical protein
MDVFNGGGFGCIYSPNHIITVGCSFLSTGAPDSPVRTGHDIVHRLVPTTSVDRWGL